MFTRKPTALTSSGVLVDPVRAARPDDIRVRSDIRGVRLAGVPHPRNHEIGRLTRAHGPVHLDWSMRVGGVASEPVADVDPE